MRDRRDLGMAADDVYSDLRKDLALGLDLAIESQEAQPTTDLWCDSAENLFALIQALVIYANSLKDLSLEGEAMMMKEVYDSLQTKH